MCRALRELRGVWQQVADENKFYEPEDGIAMARFGARIKMIRIN